MARPVFRRHRITMTFKTDSFMKSLREIATTFVILLFFYAVPNLLFAGAGNSVEDFGPVVVLALGFVLLFTFQPGVQAKDFVAHAGDRYSMAGILLAGIAGQWLIQWEWTTAGRPGTDLADMRTGLGFCLMGLGLLIRAVAFRKLRPWFTTAVRPVADRRLVMDGPYRWVRHPAYSGAILYTIGTGLFLGGTWSAGLLTLFTLAAYVYRMNVEERFLSARFPASYASYRRRTAKVIPFVW